MARENAAGKARRYLTEGRVILERVSSKVVVASVRGDGTVHRCAYSDGVWRCSCLVRTDQCAHLLAVRLVVAVDLEETR
jgi:hypothetical protein